MALATRSDERRVAGDVRNTIYRLLSVQPYLFPIVASSRVLVSNSVETASVTEEGDLVLNPEFWRSQTGTDKLVVIVHEALHVGLSHLERLKRMQVKNMELWNIACDCVINRYLRVLFPSSTLLSSGVSEKTVHRLLRALDPSLASRFEEADLEKMNEEQIYHLLIKAARNAPTIIVVDPCGCRRAPAGCEGQAGSRGSGASEALEEATRETIERGRFPSKRDVKPVEVVEPLLRGEVKRESGAGALEESPDERIRRTVEALTAAIREAVKHAGTEHAGLVESLRNLSPRGRINWTKYLLTTATKLLRDRVVSTWTVPHRRYPEIVPGPRRLPGKGIRAVFAVDCSGSIDSETLRKFIEETLWAVELLGKRIDGEVWFWDVAVQRRVPLRELHLRRSVEVTGRGGTVIDPVADELIKEVEKNPVDIFVVLTDGFVNVNDPRRVNDALRRAKVSILLYTSIPVNELRATEQIPYSHG